MRLIGGICMELYWRSTERGTVQVYNPHHICHCKILPPLRLRLHAPASVLPEQKNSVLTIMNLTVIIRQ